MDEVDLEKIMQVINSEEFQKEKDRLVKHYNISASAKYTLEPRDDFITAIIKEFVRAAFQPHL